MTPAEAPPELAVAGWRITLLEGDALYAPLRWVLPHAGESESAWLPCHVLICRRDDVTLLVDCGLGVFDDAFEDIPTRATELRDLLAAAGCAPDEITAVALTHFDPDHSGGVVSGSYPDALEPTFPKANVFVLDAALELAEGRGEARAEHAEKLVSALRRHGVEVTGLERRSERARAFWPRPGTGPGTHASSSRVAASDSSFSRTLSTPASTSSTPSGTR